MASPKEVKYSKSTKMAGEVVAVQTKGHMLTDSTTCDLVCFLESFPRMRFRWGVAIMGREEEEGEEDWSGTTALVQL